MVNRTNERAAEVSIELPLEQMGLTRTGKATYMQSAAIDDNRAGL
ncbi:hypothetical protein HH1059_20350 [Halorhodospira halochloris]|uniref:Uncharacterized protein n=1 Tax=Halorhodospira halochloris TaxID=1052 RepID=A0A2Z6EZT6_HALHR|nr:hypothetical protein [Halorhodospira halochloris]BBE11152.1 hypothetical protein HH1059_20350 [Halorhodospira halochloris]